MGRSSYHRLSPSLETNFSILQEYFVMLLEKISFVIALILILLLCNRYVCYLVVVWRGFYHLMTLVQCRYSIYSIEVFAISCGPEEILLLDLLQRMRSTVQLTKLCMDRKVAVWSIGGFSPAIQHQLIRHSIGPVLSTLHLTIMDPTFTSKEFSSFIDVHCKSCIVHGNGASCQQTMKWDLWNMFQFIYLYSCITVLVKFLFFY